MEALIAVGLASNVVQFLDFGVKLVTNAKELYSSLDSSTRRNVDLKLVKNDLEKLVIGLKPQASTDPGFQGLVTKCVSVAAELQQSLEKVTARKGRNALWSACITSFKTSWNESRLQELANRLYSLRDELQFRLIVKLSGQDSSMSSVDIKQLRNAADNVHRACQEYPKLVEGLDIIGREILSNIRLQRKALKDTERHLGQTLQRSHLETMEKLDSIQSDVNDLKNAFWNTKGITGEISALTGSEGDSNSNLDLVQTFWYRGIEDRYNDVEPAHLGTFSWILHCNDCVVHDLCEQASSFEKRCPFSNLEDYSHQFQEQMNPEWDPCNLIQWLRSGDNIFWITGKPGSGKSTMMKCIYEDRTYRSLLSEWAGTNLLLSPSFFFWRVGSSIQRSQHGLLLSLLYQIFEAQPHLMHRVIQKQERRAALANKDSKRETPYWTIQEVKRLFERLAALNDLKLCLLIDGLDEFDGDPQTIADFFQKLSQSKNVKILLSGRHLSEFRYTFQKVIVFSLHDWTRHDIESYIRGRLSENDALYNHAEVRKTEFENLIKDLLNKAEGVFIWVETAVSNLLSGLRDHDTPHELNLRLQELPNELDELYEKILRSLNERHSHQTRFYLSILLRLACDDAEPNLIIMGFAMRYDPYDISWVLKSCETDVDELETTTRGRLESRCSHLLTILDDNIGSGRVYFMHRTVIDFLNTSKGQNWLTPSNADNELAETAANMGHAQSGWLPWIRGDWTHTNEMDCLPGLVGFRLRTPLSRSARNAIEQTNLALREWSERGLISSVTGNSLPQGHFYCKSNIVCKDAELTFLQQIWKKYWPMQSHVALSFLWLQAGEAHVGCAALESQEAPLNTITKLDVMTVEFLGRTPVHISGPLLDRFCSQDSQFVELFWHRMFNLLNCRIAYDLLYEHYEWNPSPILAFIDILIGHGMNPHKILRALAFSPSKNYAPTALEILERMKSGFKDDLPTNCTLLKAMRKLEVARPIQTECREEGIYELEWELHSCEKECIEYREQKHLSLTTGEIEAEE